jgi:hypothetical protein
MNTSQPTSPNACLILVFALSAAGGSRADGSDPSISMQGNCVDGRTMAFGSLERQADLEDLDRVEVEFHVQAALDGGGLAKAVLRPHSSDHLRFSIQRSLSRSSWGVFDSRLRIIAPCAITSPPPSVTNLGFFRPSPPQHRLLTVFAMLPQGRDPSLLDLIKFATSAV